MRHAVLFIHCDDDDPTDESAAEETLKYLNPKYLNPKYLNPKRLSKTRLGDQENSVLQCVVAVCCSVLQCAAV